MTAKVVKFSEIQMGDAFLMFDRQEISSNAILRVEKGIRALTGPNTGAVLEFGPAEIDNLDNQDLLVFSVVGNRTIEETMAHLGEPVREIQN